jgi:hypothetical protein
MSEHAKEPWTIERDEVQGEPYRAGERWITESWEILVIRSGSDGNGTHEIAREVHSEVDARRIVACVNALAGISTEDIESGVMLKLWNNAKQFIDLVMKDDEPGA